MRATQSTCPMLVTIVTWNSATVLPGLLASLPDGMNGVDHRVVVVDNASEDSSRDIASAAGHLVVDTGANLGYAGAINEAYDLADDDEDILVLNPDIRLTPGFGACLAAVFDDPQVGIATPRILDDKGVTQHSLRRRPTVRRAWGEALLGGRRVAARHSSWSEVVTDPGAYKHACDVDWATGAALLVSARCRARLGRWDPTFFLYSEETEYMLRARDRGFLVRYCPDAVAHHRGGDLTTSAALWRLQVRNRIGLFRRGRGVLPSLTFQTGVVVNELLRVRSPVHRAALGTALRPSRTTSPGEAGLVVFAGVDWWYHNRAHSDVQLARHVAQERPVLMVNSLGLRMPMPGRGSQPLRRIGRKLRSSARAVRTPLPDTPNFHVLTPLALPGGGERARRVMAAFTRVQVNAAARWYMLLEPHVFVTIPSAETVVDGIPRRSLTFNRSDKQSEFPDADSMAIARMEQALLRESDHVVYVSHALMTHDRDLVGDRAHFLDHGVDSDLFRHLPPSDVPRDLQEIATPRVGFFGGLDDYVVDFDLIRTLALELPDTSIVLIGDATCSMDGLLEVPNIHWLGQRPYETMPAYGSGFDVAIMPWLNNEWVRLCNPIKLKEYLSLGLPVVTTDYPEIARYRDIVHVADNGRDFVRGVRAALVDPDARSGERRARVAHETWQEKAHELLAILDGRAPRPGLRALQRTES